MRKPQTRTRKFSLTFHEHQLQNRHFWVESSIKKVLSSLTRYTYMSLKDVFPQTDDQE